MIAAIIQARMNSTRLPGKIMMNIRNKPLLYYTINQTLHSKKIDNLIIATTSMPEDDQVVDLANVYGVSVFRGSEEDVLDRYYQCAKKHNVDIIIRITSDCPLIDPKLIDKCIIEFQNNKFDYFSNIHKKQNNHWIYHLSGFPSGFSVEVFTFDALVKAWKNAQKLSEREHVTPYFLNNPQFFKIGNLENSDDYSDIRLTVDHKIDYDLVKAVIEHFSDNEIFDLGKITSFLNGNPQLKQINSHIKFDEGYLKSLKLDALDK